MSAADGCGRAGLTRNSEAVTKSVHKMMSAERQQDNDEGQPSGHVQQVDHRHGRKKHEVIQLYSSDDELQEILPHTKRANKTK
jgi:hypothetical protein